MKRLRLVVLAIAVVAIAAQSLLTGRAEQAAPVKPPASGPFDALHFRSIGPASMSGRISDLAVYEANPAIFYVATAHGGVWKTTNNGTTFEAQFQDQGLMSIGDVTVSQSNPDLVWVGTGESNNRQSTSWGDGVYKSTDGGKTYTNMGLRDVAATSTASSSTRATTTSCSSRRPAACGARAASAASTRRPTAARPGSRCSRSTTTPARTTS